MPVAAQQKTSAAKQPPGDVVGGSSPATGGGSGENTLLKEFLAADPFYAELDRDRKKITKKLRDIAKLEETLESGGKLQGNQLAKLEEKSTLEEQLKLANEQMKDIEAQMLEQQEAALHVEERQTFTKTVEIGDKSDMTARQKARLRAKRAKDTSAGNKS
eukprot:g8525.t1